NNGEAKYDALNLSLEKRYSHNWSGRISYSLSKSTGTGNDQADKDTYQVGTNLNLDAFNGPSNVDRRHILSMGAQTEVPHSGRVAPQGAGRQSDRSLPRHLQHHEPRELRQSDCGKLGSPRPFVVPRADQPARRRRLPASGINGLPLRVLK